MTRSMEGERTFFEKNLNSAIVPNITAHSNWTIGYYLQSGWGFVFLFLRLNWFSSLPLLKGSTRFPPSLGHTFLLLPWCWLLCFSDPTIKPVPLTKPEKTNPTKQVNLWNSVIWWELKHLSEGSHQCCNWFKERESEWRKQDGRFM